MPTFIDALTAEILRVDDYAKTLRETLASLSGLNGIATAPKASKSAKATPTAKPAKAKRGAGKAALAKMGEAVIVYLSKHKGEWIAGPTLAEVIKHPEVGAAIKAADPEGKVERKGPGRKKEYRIKV